MRIKNLSLIIGFLVVLRSCFAGATSPHKIRLMQRMKFNLTRINDNEKLEYNRLKSEALENYQSKLKKLHEYKNGLEKWLDKDNSSLLAKNKAFKQK